MPRYAALFAALTLFLSACNLPFGQPVQVPTPAPTLAAIATATFTPIPTLTPVPTGTLPPTATVGAVATSTSNCNAAQFVSDITVPDGTIMDPNEDFTKTWRLKNIGTCSWTPAYAVVFSSGSSMNGPASQALTGNVNPGQTVDISVNLKAPASNGDYTGWWKLRDGGGVLFSQFYVQIEVQGGGGGGGGPFAVTGVTFDVGTFDDGSYQDCPIVTAHITANGAGDVQYNFTRSDGQGGAGDSMQTLHFNSAGTKNVSEKWYLGSAAAGTHWLGIYVGNPNHQDFGHVNVPTCDSP